MKPLLILPANPFYGLPEDKDYKPENEPKSRRFLEDVGSRWDKRNIADYSNPFFPRRKICRR